MLQEQLTRKLRKHKLVSRVGWPKRETGVKLTEVGRSFAGYLLSDEMGARWDLFPTNNCSALEFMTHKPDPRYARYSRACQGRPV